MQKHLVNIWNHANAFSRRILVRRTSTSPDEEMTYKHLQSHFRHTQDYTFLKDTDIGDRMFVVGVATPDDNQQCTEQQKVISENGKNLFPKALAKCLTKHERASISQGGKARSWRKNPAPNSDNHHRQPNGRSDIAWVTHSPCPGKWRSRDLCFLPFSSLLTALMATGNSNWESLRGACEYSFRNGRNSCKGSAVCTKFFTMVITKTTQ